jgi:hypothetical protein
VGRHPPGATAPVSRQDRIRGPLGFQQRGQFEATEYGPGDPAYLPKGTVKTMAYVGSTWMIDYGRGLPVTMMPFGIMGPAVFATLDFRSAGEQLADYGRLVLRGMFKFGGQ